MEKERKLLTELLEKKYIPCEDKLLKYLSLLLKWRRKINITGFKTPESIIVRGIIESLLIDSYINNGIFLMDVGSGAGFPAIPVKIVRDDLRIILLEPKKKKWAFLKEVVRELNLKNISVLQQRVEDKSFSFVMKRMVDVVTSRAFAEAGAVLNMVSPYLKKNGRVILFTSSRKSIKEKNGWTLEEKEYHLPLNYGSGKILIFQKCFT